MRSSRRYERRTPSTTPARAPWRIFGSLRPSEPYRLNEMRLQCAPTARSLAASVSLRRGSPRVRAVSSVRLRPRPCSCPPAACQPCTRADGRQRDSKGPRGPGWSLLASLQLAPLRPADRHGVSDAHPTPEPLGGRGSGGTRLHGIDIRWRAGCRRAPAPPPSPLPSLSLLPPSPPLTPPLGSLAIPLPCFARICRCQSKRSARKRGCEWILPCVLQYRGRATLSQSTRRERKRRRRGLTPSTCRCARPSTLRRRSQLLRTACGNGGRSTARPRASARWPSRPARVQR